MTASVVAAALVGLGMEENLAATPDGRRGNSQMEVSEHPLAANEVASFAPVTGESAATALAFEPMQDFVQRTGDVASSMRPSDEADAIRSFQDAPMSQRSELLSDSIEPVAVDHGRSAFAFGGGDEVMHSMLDLAALTSSVESGAKAAHVLPIEDAVRDAMPDMMVDRLIEAFTENVGRPANDTGGGDQDILAGILNQGIDAFHISVMTNNDISGSHQYDMATTTH